MGFFYFGSRNPTDKAFKNVITEQLREATDRCAEKHGAHVIDLVVRGERGTRVVQVFIDSREGVTTDLCAAVSNDLSATIDVQCLVEGVYRLEVSSPGIDRPLRLPWQFYKHVGRELDVKTKTAEGERRSAGVLSSVTDSGIILRVGKSNETISVPFDTLLEARVKAPW